MFEKSKLVNVLFVEVNFTYDVVLAETKMHKTQIYRSLIKFKFS